MKKKFWGEVKRRLYSLINILADLYQWIVNCIARVGPAGDNQVAEMNGLGRVSLKNIYINKYLDNKVLMLLNVFFH